LTAQSASSAHAAVAGVYIHGLAGDLAAESKTGRSLVAGDLLEFLPEAFRSLEWR
jgi:NAD(P)H-hydrate epimerase